MFLHSGASLHGHEFSRRSTQAVASPSNPRNPLLRSSLPSAANRASAPPGSLPYRDNDPVLAIKESKAYPSTTSRNVDDTAVGSRGVGPDFPASQPETMSDDGTSILSGTDVSKVSDTDASGVSSLARRKYQSTYVLAHPPPGLRTKQRIIHMRPNLVLQIQEVKPGMRPRPTIDVYPSFAGARSIMAPLLKRVSRNADIKKELSGQNIMLVKSEDYTLQTSTCENDGDEDSIMARKLLAVFIPSKNEDKTDIIMAEGMVWTATTRLRGNSHSYEFTSVDPTGNTITARWVRRQTVSSSLPTTPTSPSDSSAKPQLSDAKFTFSILNPNCRRHPVLATLTNASLSIPETYTTVAQAADRFSSTSQRSPLNSPVSSDEAPTEKRTQPVQDWQKSLISISAVWVALRNGWASNARSADLTPLRTSAASQIDRSQHCRRRSLSASTGASPSVQASEATDRVKYPVGIQQRALRSANDLPRRATSTGAALFQKRRVVREEPEEESSGSEHDRINKLNRRALSGDWNVGLSKAARENSLAKAMMDLASAPPTGEMGTSSTPALAPPPTPIKHPVSSHSPLSSLSPNVSNLDVSVPHQAPLKWARTPPQQGNAGDVGAKSRHRKWKNVSNWFRRISGR
ncbi:hypothetical protein F4802DRAFT_501725 [Xylaria palmicola]|nr:hypothetical protein F4802DRAFT_501725 [Xylaria palmicola]